MLGEEWSCGGAAGLCTGGECWIIYSAGALLPPRMAHKFRWDLKELALPHYVPLWLHSWQLQQLPLSLPGINTAVLGGPGAGTASRSSGKLPGSAPRRAPGPAAPPASSGCVNPRARHCPGLAAARHRQQFQLGILQGGLVLVGISSLCFHFALWIFNSYDRRVYIETKVLRYNGDIFLQNFYLHLTRDTSGRVTFQYLLTDISLEVCCHSY